MVGHSNKETCDWWKQTKSPWNRN